MNIKGLLALVLIYSLLVPTANATAFDVLQKQLQSEISKSSTPTKPVKSTSPKKNNKTTNQNNNSAITEISILDNISSRQFQSWDEMNSGLSEDMKVINDDILSKCRIIVKHDSTLTVDYKLHFNNSSLQKVSIVKSSGYNDADNLVIDTLKKYFKKYPPTKLNNGKPFVFIGRIRTVSFSEFAPVYILEGDLETVPTEHKEIFAKFNTQWEEAYKNSKNIEGQALVLLKVGKDGSLISTNQTELLKEFNKLYKQNIDVPKIPQAMLNELVLSAQSLFPIEPLEIMIVKREN